MDNNEGIQHIVKKQMGDTVKKIQNAPFTYKIMTCILSLFLTWFFTYFYFEFGWSVFTALVAFLSIASFQPVLAIVFALLYIYVMVNLFHVRKKTYGKVFPQTDIRENSKPLSGVMDNSNNKPVDIPFSDIPQNTDTEDFTYSFFLYVTGSTIDDSLSEFKNTWENYRYGDWKSIFYRGETLNESNKNNFIQYPGFWLSPKLNNLSIVFNNTNSSVERLEIPNIPMNEWFNVTLLKEGYSVSVYINGKLENTIILSQTKPSGDLNIFIGNDSMLSTGNGCTNNCAGNSGASSSSTSSTSSGYGGWPGYIAQLTYYPYILNNEEIINSYLFYKKIVDNYQDKLLKNIKINIPSLVTKNSVEPTSTTSVDLTTYLNQL
jgi:hypothetical protein